MKHRILFKVCTVTEIIVGSLLLSVVLIALAPFIYFGMLVALYGNPIMLIIAVLAAHPRETYPDHCDVVQCRESVGEERRCASEHRRGA